MKKGMIRKVVERTFGFLIFLILLAVANYLTIYIHNYYFVSIIGFLVYNLVLSFIIFIVGVFSDVFWRLKFPLNLLAPFITAISSLLILTYIFRMWNLLNTFVATNAVIPEYLVYSLVFILTILIGYFIIIIRMLKQKEKADGQEKLKSKEKNEEKTIDWEDIGEQFKSALYGLGKSLNSLFTKDKDKNTKKKRR